MIILVLKGGLGNQLFQYATGRALSLKNGEELKFDASGYEKIRSLDTPREYLLSHFNICDAKMATDEEIKAFKYPHGNISKSWRMVRTKLGLHNVGWVPRIMRKKGDIFLDGYWQTEKYFTGCADAIRRELSLKEPMGQAGQTMAKLISANPESVSLHVRRGDVARDAATNPYAGITTPEYYKSALSYIGTRFKKPHIFIFSDDPKWVTENIDIPYPSTIVSGIGIPDYEEIILMSKCRAHVIANSSFSWWGAWLDPQKDKVIVAPKQWIRRTRLRHKDTVPKSWIRV